MQRNNHINSRSAIIPKSQRDRLSLRFFCPTFHDTAKLVAVFLVGMLLCPIDLSGAETAIEVESFSEPYRRIEIAASEMGVLTEINVAEGAYVDPKQVLARLDDAVLEKSLEVARAAKEASGSLQAAMVELESKQNQLESYHSLRRNSHATNREIERATTAVAIAQAKLQIARDELAVRRTECERTRAQLERRRILSPISGTVIEIKKEVGEFVSPSDPVVMTVVDLTSLKLVFSLPHRLAAAIRPGQLAPIRIDQQLVSNGIVEFVSPAIDPETGTVRIKIRIPNPEGRIPCGVLCSWDGSTTESDQQVSLSPRSHSP